MDYSITFLDSMTLTGGSENTTGNDQSSNATTTTDNQTTAETAQGTTTAQTTTGAPSPFPMFMTVFLWVGIIAVFYLLLIRPQRKRDKQIKEMQEGIHVGDNVVTASGFYGNVTSIGEDCFVVEFGSPRGIRIPVRKSEILGIKTPSLTPTKHESSEFDQKSTKAILEDGSKKSNKKKRDPLELKEEEYDETEE